jgi:hypothetical protein
LLLCRQQPGLLNPLKRGAVWANANSGVSLRRATRENNSFLLRHFIIKYNKFLTPHVAMLSQKDRILIAQPPPPPPLRHRHFLDPPRSTLEKMAKHISRESLKAF